MNASENLFKSQNPSKSLNLTKPSRPFIVFDCLPNLSTLNGKIDITFFKQVYPNPKTVQVNRAFILYIIHFLFTDRN